MTGTVTTLEQITKWAAEHRDIDGVLLVGSHARGEARADSDVDLVILAGDPSLFLTETSWVTTFGNPLQIEREDYGAVQSIRTRYADGQEVEFGITSAGWASIDPLDPGTAQVVCDGARILVDKAGSLKALVAACEAGASSRE